MDFSVWDRIHYAYAPSYNCINKKDAFSVRNNEAKLTYPVALMTADEAFFAGGIFQELQEILIKIVVMYGILATLKMNQ